MKISGQTILGAIFAGGVARRFGSDKAAAQVDGRAMIEQVAERLRPQCDALVVVGRDWPGLCSVPDRPEPGLGPLGALAGALYHAQACGFDLVLTSGCDLPDLPLDLARRLLPAPAIIAGQPLLGLWHASDADSLTAWLAAGKDRAMRSWTTEIGARKITLATTPANINTQDDLARYNANPAR